MEIDNAIIWDLESFGRVLSKWLWKYFGCLFRKMQQYPEMDIIQCGINHHTCYVCSF